MDDKLLEYLIVTDQVDEFLGLKEEQDQDELEEDEELEEEEEHHKKRVL